MTISEFFDRGGPIILTRLLQGDPLQFGSMPQLERVHVLLRQASPRLQAIYETNVSRDERQ